MDLVCSGLSLPRGCFPQPSGSSSAEIRRSSSTGEHLENACVWGLEPKCKKQQVHKRTFRLLWTLQPDQTRLLLFALISLPQKCFITPPGPGSHLKDRDRACPLETTVVSQTKQRCFKSPASVQRAVPHLEDLEWTKRVPLLLPCQSEWRWGGPVFGVGL